MSQIYSPRAVAERLGISPVTLRAWARKFRSVLSPQAQTASGARGGRIQRWYTEADIETLHRLSVLLDSGMDCPTALLAFESGSAPDPAAPESLPDPAEPPIAPAAAAPLPDPAAPEPPPNPTEPSRAPAAAAPLPDITQLLAAIQTAYVTALAAKNETIAAQARGIAAQSRTITAQARTIATLQDALERQQTTHRPPPCPRSSARSRLRTGWHDLAQWLYYSAI